MQLSHFIQTLLTEGSVTVQGQLIAFDEADITATKTLLQQYYLEDVLELPGIAPSFVEEAALWAAEYFYKAVQLSVLRDIKQEQIADLLQNYSGVITPESVYSADLILRYLPALFHLAKGLSPADALVTTLRTLAVQWPLSSVGIEINSPVDDDIILANPSLAQVYIDRIIERKDKNRVTTLALEKRIYQVAGGHLSIFWPNYEPIIQLTIDASNIERARTIN
jgi:hypothetical protein